MQTSGRREEEEHLNPTAVVQRRRRRKRGRLPARRRSHTRERRLFFWQTEEMETKTESVVMTTFFGSVGPHRKWRRVFVGAGLRRGLVLAVPQMAAVAVSGVVAPRGPAFFLLLLRLFVRSVVASVGGGAGTEDGGGGVSIGAERRRRRSYMQQHAVSVVAGANKANWKCDVENTDKGNQSGPESDRRPSGAPNLRPGVSSCQHAPPMLS